MVVHRQPEQDHEQEQRQPRDDRAVRLEAEDALGPVVLEHEHQHAVGCGDREQVQHDRLQRHDERAEREQQQSEAEQQHEGDHVRQPVLHLVREVDVLGREAGHCCLHAGHAAERLRHELLPQHRDRVPALRRSRRGRQRQLDRAALAVRAGTLRERGPGDAARDRERLELLRRDGRCVL